MPRFLLKWGSERGKAPGQFSYPGGVAVLARSQDSVLVRSQDSVLVRSQDRVLARPQDSVLVRSQDSVLVRSRDRGLLVFVVDMHNRRIQSFRSDGTLFTHWSVQADDRNDPLCVAVHSTQNCIFVAYNYGVQVFGVDGSFIRKWGSYGRGDGQFCGISGLAILQNHLIQDLIYVADSDNHRIQVFNLDGLFVTKWGTRGTDDGQFCSPSAVVVHPTRDLVFVSEGSGNRVQAFRSAGAFLFKWGTQGSADGQFQSPQALALHPTRDLLFVADTQNHRVQVFHLDGSFVCKWGFQGRADGEFSSPWGMCVHPTSEVLYVSDEFCVQAFSIFHTIRKRKRDSDL